MYKNTFYGYKKKCSKKVYFPESDNSSFTEIEKYFKPKKTKITKRTRAGNDRYLRKCPVHPCCCIYPNEVDDTLPPLPRKKKNPIQICRNKCIVDEGDKYLFSKGKKRKQHLIEIRIKTPKTPTVLLSAPKNQYTQIDEIELEAELKKVCTKKEKKKKVPKNY